MIAQAFFFNAIFFTAAQVLEKYYGVAPGKGSWYLFAFALGNAFGPVCLGGLFDTVGRKPMIAGTYALSGILLAASGWLFAHGMLTANTQTLAWTIIFFIASSAASSAYLTVSEIFPARNPRHGDCDLLRHWHADRRLASTDAFRVSHRP